MRERIEQTLDVLGLLWEAVQPLVVVLPTVRLGPEDWSVYSREACRVGVEGYGGVVSGAESQQMLPMALSFGSPSPVTVKPEACAMISG